MSQQVQPKDPIITADSNCIVLPNNYSQVIDHEVNLNDNWSIDCNLENATNMPTRQVENATFMPSLENATYMPNNQPDNTTFMPINNNLY